MKTKGMFLMIIMALMGCATSKNFGRITPGMTTQQVADIMKKGPSMAKTYDDEYAVWYYGEDRCLVLHHNAVVEKQQTQETRSVEVFGLGSYSSTDKAVCLPPSLAKGKKTEHTVTVPFVGTVQTK